MERPRTASARAWEQSATITNNTLHALSRAVDGSNPVKRPGTASAGGVLRPSTATARPDTGSSNYGPTFLPTPSADDMLTVNACIPATNGTRDVFAALYCCSEDCARGRIAAHFEPRQHGGNADTAGFGGGIWRRFYIRCYLGVR
jgi:hypothetical protein